MKPELDNITIKGRRDLVLGNIKAAATTIGREAGSIELIAVSKLQDDDRIRAMLETGHKVFGENRVQEAKARWGDRFSDECDGLTLHLIGPLQTNKVDDAVALFDVIETVDREKLVKALVKSCEKLGRRPKIYVQVNIGEEEQKSGVLPNETVSFVEMLRRDYNWEPEGLMCIPPMAEAPSPHFWLLANLAAQCGLSNLSMGMSGDYEIAVKMGATNVRVGAAMFGARQS